MKPDQRDLVKPIIEAIGTNTLGTWKRPWARNAGEIFPTNVTTGAAYSGLNILLLWIAAANRAYSSDRWFTFRQKNDWSSKNGIELKIRKGETASRIFRVIDIVDKDAKPTAEDHRTFRAVKVYSVFNIDQLEETPDAWRPVPLPIPAHPMSLCDAFAASLGIRLVHRGDRAFYMPSADAITMPQKALFPGPGDYYATLLHEIVHWSGQAGRAGFRPKIEERMKSPTDRYNFEELVAEFGSLFLCHALQVEYAGLQHANYIGAYAKLLDANPRLVMSAARHASDALAFLLAHTCETAAAA